jgi:hypothetical protein
MSRARLRPAFEWIAATAGAAAILVVPWAVVAILVTDSRTVRIGGALAIAASVGAAWLLVRLRRPASPWPTTLAVLVGAGLVVSALAVITFLGAWAMEPDACGSQPADTFEWLGLVGFYLAAGAWSLREGKRALWALPLGFTLGAAWFLGLVAAFPGPLNCGD